MSEARVETEACPVSSVPAQPPELWNVTAKLSELKREDAQLSVTFLPAYPARERIRNQIAEIEKELQTEKDSTVEMIRIEYAASVERENQLSKALEAQREEVNKTNQEIVRYNILGREAVVGEAGDRFGLLDLRK